MHSRLYKTPFSSDGDTASEKMAAKHEYNAMGPGPELRGNAYARYAGRL